MAHAYRTVLGRPPREREQALALEFVGGAADGENREAAWAQLQQRSAGWGLAVLALPGYWITLSLSTADLLATTLLRSIILACNVSRRRAKKRYFNRVSSV